MAQPPATLTRPLFAGTGGMALGHGFVEGFLKSWGVILASEIGDKTFFIAAILAMRHPRQTVRTRRGGGVSSGRRVAAASKPSNDLLVRQPWLAIRPCACPRCSAADCRRCSWAPLELWQP